MSLPDKRKIHYLHFTECQFPDEVSLGHTDQAEAWNSRIGHLEVRNKFRSRLRGWRINLWGVRGASREQTLPTAWRCFSEEPLTRAISGLSWLQNIPNLIPFLPTFLWHLFQATTPNALLWFAQAVKLGPPWDSPVPTWSRYLPTDPTRCHSCLHWQPRHCSPCRDPAAPSRRCSRRTVHMAGCFLWALHLRLFTVSP